MPASLFNRAGLIRTGPLTLLLAAALLAPRLAAAEPQVARIWDQAPHNAFTDLIRWRGAFYCTFREAKSHVGGSDGKIRVIRSADGGAWEPVALLAEAGVDLRDPKLSETPDGRLMLLMGGSVYEGRELLSQRGRAAFLAEPGGAFSALTPLVIDERVATSADWVWRVTWQDGAGYGTLYQRDSQANRRLHLLRTADGIHYSLVKSFGFESQPNESTVRFLPDGRMVMVVRDESEARVGHIGVSAAPFSDWRWSEIGYQLGGPNLIALPDGAWILGTRLHADDGAHTVVGPVTLGGAFRPAVTLPSGGDTSYPGLVWHDGELWVSYYSSHEEKTAIYLARIALRDFAAQ